LYLATRHGLWRSIDEEKFSKLPTEEEFAKCIMEDREGGLWVGYTGDLGLRCYRNGKTRTLLSEYRMNCVHEETDGSMWFGSNSGLHSLGGERITNYGIADGLPDAFVGTIAKSRSGGFWIGTRKGLAKWSDNELSIVTAPAELAQLNISSAFEDSTGVLWLALDSSGGYSLRDGALTRLTDLDHGSIKWFYEASPKQLWVGHEYGLFRIHDGQIEQVRDSAFDRLNSSHFTCYYAVADGTLWLGTAGGIVRYRSGSFDAVTSADGLAADYVDRMQADNHGNLWLAGRDGFYYVSLSELNEVANGSLPKVTSRRVQPIKGVAISGYQPKGCLAKDGTTWMAAYHGVISVPPDSLHKNVVPPIVDIEEVRLDGESVDADGDFEFLSGSHRVAIDFAALTFTRAQFAQVEYRLDGIDEDWINAGQERVAYYTDLRPGRYTFRIRAENGDGVWVEEDESISFTVKPRWWETAWFPVVSALGLVGITFAGTWQFVRRGHRRNAVLRQEIDERKRSETRFRDLAASTHAIPWEADANMFRFTFVGHQAVEALGYPTEQWLEEDFWVEHIHPEDRLEAVEYCQRATDRGVSHQFEYRMIAADGGIVWLNDVAHVTMKDGVATKLSGFMVDVTARRNAEEEANNYLRQLARMDRAASLGEMATSIAHEVNQPLFAIVSNAQTARRLLDREQPDVEEVREALGDIVDDGNRASGIIDRVRSRVRKQEQPNEQLNINKVALEVVQFVNAEIRKRGLTLDTALADELPMVSADAIELQQVILNLIINAAHAMEEMVGDSNELLLTTSSVNGHVELAVKDAGIGLDEEEADRLFEPFFTTRTNGVGMGLAISRTIVEAHDGRIWATSNDDGGATFHFSLPAVTGANV
jgi:PAS domain S-box-containing protein